MSTEDQLLEEDEASEGDKLGSLVSASEGFILRSISRADALLSRVSLTPGPRPPSREGQLQEGPAGDPLSDFRSVLYLETCLQA